MIKIELKSPQIVTFDTTKRINAKISHNRFSENVMGIDLPINFKMFINTSEFNEAGVLILPMNFDKIFNENLTKQLISVEKIIDTCKKSSELLLNKLESLNIKLNKDNEYNTIFEKYPKLDFMANKNILKDIIKSKKNEFCNKVIIEYDMKSLTTSFNNFILDRNKYTHGHLYYWYHENKTLIEYKNSSKQFVYGEVNKDVFNSFINCYKELNEFLNKIEDEKV